MTLPSTGPLKLSQIADEFQKPRPTKLSDLLGAGPGIPTVGPLKWSDFLGKSMEITKFVNSGSYNALVIQNLFSASELSSPNPKRVIFRNGAVCYSNNTGVPALRTGVVSGGLTLQFETGSEVQGAGGAGGRSGGAGGNGGDAFLVETAGTIIMHSGAFRGGAGGGGSGGYGGNGGNGNYTVYTRDPVSGFHRWGNMRWHVERYSWRSGPDGERDYGNKGDAYWNGEWIWDNNRMNDVWETAVSQVPWFVDRNGWRYYRDSIGVGSPPGSRWDTGYLDYGIARDRTDWYNSTGGRGGLNTNFSAGGNGQGYGQAQSNGQVGEQGLPGGQNAGRGGNSGNGGNGGGWGQNGSPGARGQDGTGGNVSGGTSGQNGGAGGTAGFAIRNSGAGSYTLSGSGIIQGNRS